MPHHKVANLSKVHNKLYHKHHQYALNLFVVVLVTMGLVSCEQTNNNNITNEPVTIKEADFDAFAGCYTVTYGEPAQIKISKQADGWVMQMKEPARKNRVWDMPEPLQEVDKRQIGQYFSIDGQHVTAMIGRPDRVLVLAHVTEAYTNIDPLLDSQYLAYIYQGANTIYKVPCDNTNTDIVANPHANIIIEQVTPSNEADTMDKTNSLK
ncbi:hypothetical protein [Psychrobacter sp. I-STPA10]|uniref:hypothetical protein n=1 Tax=Psychrobacter sp. I-STPA10 TaxID=2585769 RepID=UPI001E5B568A|nr:hypothetical protein [Psychrobacter sp. I-STPA10]